MEVHILNVCSPVGFSEAALSAIRRSAGVREVIKAEIGEDGRYHDLWLSVTAEFSELAVELGNRGEGAIDLGDNERWN